MIGCIIFSYFLMLISLPNYEDMKGKKIYNEITKSVYNVWAHFVSILVSLMINFLILGWFI